MKIPSFDLLSSIATSLGPALGDYEEPGRTREDGEGVVRLSHGQDGRMMKMDKEEKTEDGSIPNFTPVELVAFVGDSSYFYCIVPFKVGGMPCCPCPFSW